MRYYRIAASRGRDKDNPKIRGRSNSNYRQRLEMGSHTTSNTITSVEKDNYVCVFDEYETRRT